MNKVDLKKFAKKFLEVNVNVLPTISSKKYPAVKSWKQYQSNFITEKEIENFFTSEIDGIGVVCGKISGGLECIDIDNKFDSAQFIYDELNSTSELNSILSCCIVEKSQSGGFHIFYRCENISRNQKIASKKKNGGYECIIETRGEGGFCVVDPTGGYELIRGSWTSIPFLSIDEREILFSYLKSFNEEVKEKNFSDTVSKSSRYEEKPGDAYNNSQDGINEAKVFLNNFGWELVRTSGDGAEYWRRPGAKTNGIDATFRDKIFYVFSTNAHPFESNHSYTPFSILITLKFDGDIKGGVKHLVGRGFGKIKKSERSFPKDRSDGKDGSEDSELFYEVGFKKDVPFLKINKNNFLSFLNVTGGFWKYYISSGDVIIVRIENFIVEQVTISQVKDFVFSFIDNIQEPIFENFTKDDLRNLVLTYEKQIFVYSFMEFLSEAKIQFMRDSDEESYFFFKNCWVRANASGLSSVSYSKLNAHIWKKQIISRGFEEADFQNSDFQIFVKNICKGEPDRIAALESCLGYLLSTYKDPANAKAVIFCDEGNKYSASDESSGRSGKSLVGKAIGKLRNECRVDGKNFKIDKPFAFQSINLDTQLIHFNDVPKRFDFEKLFSIITDAITVEKKNRDEFIIPFEHSPKILLSTNFALESNGGSSDARQFTVEFSDFYSLAHCPCDDFEKRFFDEWNQSEWKKFDNYLLNCSVLFHSEGLVPYRHRNLLRKQISQGTCFEFFEYMEENLKIGEKFFTTANFNKFISENPHLEKELTLKSFGKWISKYATTNRLYFVRGRSSNGSDRFWLFQKDSKLFEDSNG